MSLFRRSRPLLTATIGLATLTLTGCGNGCGCVGNLMPPSPCPEGQFRVEFLGCSDSCPPGTVVRDDYYEDYCERVPDAGTDAGADAGTDAGADAGSDGG
jgi:hypothetical protein